MIKSKNKILHIILFLIIFAGSINFYLLDKARTRIVCINLTHLVNGFEKHISKKSDPKNMKLFVNKYEKVLQVVLKNYANKNHVQIVSYKVAIAGVEDVTNKIEHEMSTLIHANDHNLKK